MNEEKGSDFESLAACLSGVADDIANLSRPGLLDAVSLASPFFVDEESDDTVQLAIERMKSMTGLGPYQDPLRRYLEVCVEVDNEFTRKRCRTDRRAKKFLTLQKQMDSFLNRKIPADVFVLRIREQVLLLQSLHNDPPKKRTREKVKTETKEAQKDDIPEGIRDFLMRKFIQSLLVSIPIGILVYVITFDILATALGISGCIAGVFIGILFELLYYYAYKDTNLRRAVAYIVLAAYATTFLLCAGYYLNSIRFIIGYYTDVILLMMLLITEIIARWGPLNILVRVTDYIHDGLILFVFFIIAQIVSVLIGETVWVAISVISGFYTVWDKRGRDNKQ